MMDYTLRIDRPSEQVIPDLVEVLQRRGLPVKLTFDLQLACADQVGCQCPHHGTTGCTCQYAVLLVYPRQPGPGGYLTITAHGRDGQVWLSLLQAPALPAGFRAIHEALGAELLEVLLGLAATPKAAVEETEGADVPSDQCSQI
ncbi:MAG: hypothetical protein ACE5H9_07025 [Anaerolineae bacterium]